jgi:hypothetical protein
MGGIYTLFNIAKDKFDQDPEDKEIDRICGILCSFMRDQVPINMNLFEVLTIYQNEGLPSTIKNARVDIQAVFDVLFSKENSGVFYLRKKISEMSL